MNSNINDVSTGNVYQNRCNSDNHQGRNTKNVENKNSNTVN